MPKRGSSRGTDRNFGRQPRIGKTAVVRRRAASLKMCVLDLTSRCVGRVRILAYFAYILHTT